MKWLDSMAGWSWRNPVTLKALRIGLRERRIFILQVAYLSLLLLISLVSLPGMFESPNSEQLAEKGKEFFIMLFGLQLMLLLVTAPALTCGSLSSERERHSLDMVLASRITSGQLVAGKLGFAAYCLLLLLASALPLASICFFLGGVTLWEALSCYFELFLFGMLAASVGLFSSAREARSNYATVQSYLLLLVSSFFLLPYMVLRFEERNTRLPVGPYFWTFNQTWELSVYHFFVGLALYLIGFLFVKARHRLRPEARNLKSMARLFLLFYLFCMAWLVGLQVVLFASHPSDNGFLGTLLFMAHIGFVGLFLNPNNLESPLERSRFQASPYSRPLFWLGLSALGCSVPVALAWGLGAGEQELSWQLGFTIFYLLVYPVNVWLFQKAWLPRWQFAWAYYLGLLLLQFFPALGAFGEHSDFWKMTFVSPFATLIVLADRKFDESFVLAIAFQLGLLVLLAGLYRWRRARL